ncbi:protein translocase subunit SecD [Aliikangiella marina]|uniref:Protein translocase subunit SecD n=1 Tax=Aliikangiella marina TaxID=1712262 RepID=A0A545THY1_9GAMM|nr:protein translocase subunit SecD [Aliikangiella marina]TQV76837.1 protein translocase subunit SecD [Aliikangiella marina]
MLYNQQTVRPINTYAGWKYAMLVIVLALAILYALPNIYGEDYALQVSGPKGGPVAAEMFEQIEQNLKDNGVEIKKSTNEDGRALIRLFDSETQLKARRLTAEFLRDKGDFGVALNLAPATPEWLENLGGSPLKLGLDLRGGVHFLMEVDMEQAISKKEDQYIDDFKSLLREQKLRYASVVRVNDVGLVARFRDEETRDSAESEIRQRFNELNTRSRETGELYEVVITIPQVKITEIKDYALQQNIATLRNRINELGVAEPLIQQQGAERILIQLPGVQDSERAKRILGATATISFQLVNESAGYNPSRAPAGAELIKEEDTGINHAIRKSPLISGEHLTDANVGYDENSMPQINVNLDSEGGAKMLAMTSKNINKPMAIIMRESKGIYEEVDGELKLVDTKLVTNVVSAPNIGAALGSSFRITGRFSPTEARDLALILRSGSLIAPAYFVEERTVGPSLGKQNIELGKTSIIVGFIAVLIFMLIYYKVFGLVANIALTSNLVFIVALMSLIPGATLTLPGIAGIVLTVGMAVDANVLIFERIREELREGTNPAQAIHNGYDKAFSTIADANITTLIAALVLFGIGTGPVKGFAVTLFLGILTSMFTAIVGSRAIVNLIYGGKSLKKISI